MHGRLDAAGRTRNRGYWQRQPLIITGSRLQERLQAYAQSWRQQRLRAGSASGKR